MYCIDYGARFYDAQVARWHGVDKVAEKYSNLSPYNYVANNPLVYFDRNGDDIIYYDANYRVIARITLPGKDIGFRYKNYVASEGHQIQHLDLSKYDKARMGVDAVGISIDASAVVGGGFTGGFEHVEFLSGEDRLNSANYVKIGPGMGVDIGVGPTVFAAWFNDKGKDEAHGASSWTGFFSGYNLTSPVGGFSIFWSTKDGGSTGAGYPDFTIGQIQKMLNDREGGINWFGIGYTPIAAKLGGKWSSQYYWQLPSWTTPQWVTEKLLSIERVDPNNVKQRNMNRTPVIEVGNLEFEGAE